MKKDFFDQKMSNSIPKIEGIKPMQTGRRRIVFLFLFALFILLIDALAKFLIKQYMPLMSWAYPFYPYDGFGVFKDFFGIDFVINHTINQGGAWGILATYPRLLLSARILIVSILIIYLIFFNQEKKKEVAFIMIISGAIGNIIDTFIYGHVIDMFHFVFWGYSYPVFNIADISIFIGVMLAFIQTFSEKIKEHKAQEQLLGTQIVTPPQFRKHDSR